MRLRVGFHRMALCLGATAATSALLGAQGDTVVVTVGDQRVTAREVQERLAAVPEFQRRTMSEDERKLPRAYLDRVLVPELLLSAEARRRKLESSHGGRVRTTLVLRDALIEELADEVESRHPVTNEEVRAFYDKHQDRFRAPSSIRIWRILVDDDRRAREIIEAARAIDGPMRWSELAREHSRDKATAMRKGDLGFVQSDGRTSSPQLRVDGKLYEAALQVKDGEVVPQPVPEGKRLAVVWRRGTRPGFERPLEEVRTQIQTALRRDRQQRALTALLDGLRRKHVTHLDQAPLADIDALPVRGVEELPPPILSARGAAGPPRPKPTDRGLR